MRIPAIAPESTVFPIGISCVTPRLKSAAHHAEGMTFTTKAAHRARGGKRFDPVITGGLSAGRSGHGETIAGVVNEAGAGFVTEGGLVTSEPELMMSAIRATFAVIVEGERAAVELVRNQAEGGDPGGLPGLVVRRGAAGVPWGREREGSEHGDRVANGGSGATIPGALCSKRRRP